jgi:HD-GYP domain-containing protein (c-di-GMP phosphodiesterase class II)
MPALAPIVAFEHHLRADGTGYPAASRTQLNLGTSLVGIADVYDAMRSQRVYHKGFPTDRILVVLQENDGKQFDQNWCAASSSWSASIPRESRATRLRRIAVVLKAHAPDPYRPRVRILFTSDGKPIPRASRTRPVGK